jgi:hypothetical protein
VNPRTSETLVVGAAVAYLVVLAWSMANLSYDMWGTLVTVPLLALASVAGLRRLFAGDHAHVLAIMYVGLAAKAGGVLARYWVGFEAYGGSIDAQAYHDESKAAAAAIWSGRADPWSAVPTATGTAFQEQFTDLVYTLTGTSKLAGFFFFGFLGFWGSAWLVKAALVSVPGLFQRRYAWLVALAPSVVYWPSSIGKEATMLFFLGLGTFGIASLLAKGRGWLPLVMAALGLGSAALLRPHVVGLWLAGLFPALLVAFAALGRGRRGKGVDRLILSMMIVVVAVGMVFAAIATVNYLDPYSDEATVDSLTQILDETTRRTGQAGSNFEPPRVDRPIDWPYASLRTLTRPLPGESRGLAQHLAALEVGALLALCAVYCRNVARLPGLVLRVPYVAFAVSTTFLAGLAYASFANLGVLTRQKSLIFPFLLLLPCLPLTVPKRRADAPSAPAAEDESVAVRVPALRDSWDGQPPARRTMPDDIWA